MAISAIRTVIIYIFIIAAMRIMGKRQLGELQPVELVVTLLISDLAAVPMQESGMPLLNGLIPILCLLSLSMLLSLLSLKSLRLRGLICGQPTILIREGHIQQAAMRQNRFTLDELLEELRGQGISDPTTVKYAVLENSGQLSILLRADQQPITPAQLNKSVEDDVFLPIVLINDGLVIHQNLRKCGRDVKWLEKELADRHLRAPSEVFLMTLDQGDHILCIPKEGQS